MNQEQKEALFGRSANFSEHKEGDEIQFQCGAEIKQGKILHVRAPGQAIIDGKVHPLLYIVDTGKGFPVKVHPSDVIEGSLPAVQPIIAIIASYGYPKSKLPNKEAAEDFAVKAQGYVVTQKDGKQLRVLNAHVGGDDVRGDVIAECEAVQSSFPVILASYGAPTNGCTLSRKAAENLAVNVQGQVIDTDQGRLRVLSARVEGDERQGQVVAECEAMIESDQKGE